MTDTELDRCLAEGCRVFAELAGAVADGSHGRSDLFVRVRLDADVLCSLLDHAPESRHAEINYLLDRCDALLAALVH